MSYKPNVILTDDIRCNKILMGNQKPVSANVKQMSYYPGGPLVSFVWWLIQSLPDNMTLDNMINMTVFGIPKWTFTYWKAIGLYDIWFVQRFSWSPTVAYYLIGTVYPLPKRAVFSAHDLGSGPSQQCPKSNYCPHAALHGWWCAQHGGDMKVSVIDREIGWDMDHHA